MGGNRRNRGRGRANGQTRVKQENDTTSNFSRTNSIATTTPISSSAATTSSMKASSTAVTPTTADTAASLLSSPVFTTPTAKSSYAVNHDFVSSTCVYSGVNAENNNNSEATPSQISTTTITTNTTRTTINNNNNNSNNLSPQSSIPLLRGEQEMSATRVYVRVRPFNQRERDFAFAASTNNSNNNNNNNSSNGTRTMEITKEDNNIINGSSHPNELLGRAAKITMSLRSTMQINSNNPSAITTLDPANQFLPKTTYYFEKCFDSVAVIDRSLEDVTVRSLSTSDLVALSNDQSNLYREVGLPVLKSALDGYNGCIFAYGQTGSGKTYTMMGPSTEFANMAKDATLRDKQSNNINSSNTCSDNAHSLSNVTTINNSVADVSLEGIIPRLARELFASLREKRNVDSAHSFRVELEYFEIYNEKVIDLLSSNSNNNNNNTSSNCCTNNNNELRVRNSSQGPYIEHLTRKHVENEEEIVSWLHFGNAERHTASTKMNERSSRSHAILSLHLVQMKISEDDIGSRMTSKVNLVDLAGSERTGMSGAVGAHFNEAVKINLSLTTLGRVIDALADLSQGKRNVFCPYRDSNLTWILMDSLGGNSKTTMVATISPHPINFDEANQTLRYAARAKQIVAKVIVNEDPQIRQIKLLTAEVERLQKLVNGEVSSDDYVDNLRERVGLLQASLEEKEVIIAQHEAELDALHNTVHKLQVANEALQTSTTGRELSKLRLDLAKLKEENAKQIALKEQNKQFQDKVQELNQTRASLEKQLQEERKHNEELMIINTKNSSSYEFAHSKEDLNNKTTPSLDKVNRSMIQKLHEMNMIKNDSELRNVNICTLLEQLVEFSYNTHKSLVNIQATNLALVQQYEVEESKSVCNKEVREWEKLEELGKQLLQRHAQAAESMVALRSVRAQFESNNDGVLRNVNNNNNNNSNANSVAANNNNNDRQWKELLKEKDEELVQVYKTAENDKWQLQRKINELNEANTRLNLELRQNRIDLRREREKQQSTESKLQTKVNSLNSELRSLKATLTPPPKWSRNNSITSFNGNSAFVHPYTQRTLEEPRSVTSRAALLSRSNLFNSSFASTPRIARGSNVITTPTVCKAKNMTARSNSRRSIRGSVETDNDNENDNDDDDNNNNNNNNNNINNKNVNAKTRIKYGQVQEIVIKSPNEHQNIINKEMLSAALAEEQYQQQEQQQEEKEKENKLSMSRQEVSPRHSHSRSTAQPPRSRSRSVSSTSQSVLSFSPESPPRTELSPLSNETNLQSSLQKVMYDTMIMQLDTAEAHERCCLIEVECQAFNEALLSMEHNIAECKEVAHKLEIMHAKLTEEETAFAQTLITINENNSELLNKEHLHVREIHECVNSIHSSFALWLNQTHEYESVVLASHVELWNDAVWSVLSTLCGNVQQLATEKVKMNDMKNKEISEGKEKLEMLQEKHNAAVEALENQVKELHDHVANLENCHTTLQYQLTEISQNTEKIINVCNSEHTERVKLLNDEQHEFVTTILMCHIQETLRINEQQVLCNRNTMENAMQQAMQQLQSTLTYTEESLSREKIHASAIEEELRRSHAITKIIQWEHEIRQQIVCDALNCLNAQENDYLNKLYTTMNSINKDATRSIELLQCELLDKEKEWQQETVLLRNAITEMELVNGETECRARVYNAAWEEFNTRFVTEYTRSFHMAHISEMNNMTKLKQAMEEKMEIQLQVAATKLESAEELWNRLVSNKEQELQELQLHVEHLENKLQETHSSAVEEKDEMQQTINKLSEQLLKETQTHKEQIVKYESEMNKLSVELHSAQTQVKDRSDSETRLQVKVSQLERNVNSKQRQVYLARRDTLREEEESIRHQLERDEVEDRLSMEETKHFELQRKNRSEQHSVQEVLSSKVTALLKESEKLNIQLHETEVQRLTLQTLNDNLSEKLLNLQTHCTKQSNELTEVKANLTNETLICVQLAKSLEELENKFTAQSSKLQAQIDALQLECDSLHTENLKQSLIQSLTVIMNNVNEEEVNARDVLYDAEEHERVALEHELITVMLNANASLFNLLHSRSIEAEAKEQSWNEMNEKKDNEIARLRQNLEFNANLDECDNTNVNVHINASQDATTLHNVRNVNDSIDINNNSFAFKSLDLSQVERSSSSVLETNNDNNNLDANMSNKGNTSFISFTPRPVTPRAYSYTNAVLNKPNKENNSHRSKRMLTTYIESMFKKFQNKDNVVITDKAVDKSTLIPVNETNSISQFSQHVMQSANPLPVNLESYQQSGDDDFIKDLQQEEQEQEEQLDQTHSKQSSNKDVKGEEETNNNNIFPAHAFTLTTLFSRRASTLTNLTTTEKNSHELNNNNDSSSNNNNLNNNHSNTSATTPHNTKNMLTSIASQSSYEIEKQKGVSLHDFLASDQQERIPHSNNMMLLSSSNISSSHVPARMHKKSHTPNVNLGHDGINAINVTQESSIDRTKNIRKTSPTVIRKRGMLPRGVNTFADANSSKENGNILINNNKYNSNNGNNNSSIENNRTLVEPNVIYNTRNKETKGLDVVYSGPAEDEYKEEIQVANNVPELPLQWRK